MTRTLDFADGFDSNSAPTGSPPAGSSIIIQDEGTPIANTPHTELNFIGVSVVPTDGGSGVADITITSNLTIQDEGTPVASTPHTTLNFVGVSVAVTNAGAGVATVTIASNITVQEEGVSIAATPHTILNFVGTGITAANAGGGIANITVVSQIIVQDEGTPVTSTPHTILNFVGAGVVVTNAGGGVSTITIASPSAAITIQEEGSGITATPHAALNFIGDNVTASDAGGSVADITIVETYTYQSGLKGVGASETNFGSDGLVDSTSGWVPVKDGEIFGISCALDDPRTAGTCTAQSVLNGVAQNAGGETAVIDATETQFIGQLLSSPVAYSAGDQIQLQTVTVSFSPNGANATMTLFARDT